MELRWEPQKSEITLEGWSERLIFFVWSAALGTFSVFGMCNTYENPSTVGCFEVCEGENSWHLNEDVVWADSEVPPALIQCRSARERISLTLENWDAFKDEEPQQLLPCISSWSWKHSNLLRRMDRAYIPSKRSKPLLQWHILSFFLVARLEWFIEEINSMTVLIDIECAPIHRCHVWTHHKEMNKSRCFPYKCIKLGTLMLFQKQDYPRSTMAFAWVINTLIKIVGLNKISPA